MVSEAKKAAARRYYARNASPEWNRAREDTRDIQNRNTWRKDKRLKSPAANLYHSSQQSAKKKGQLFTITREQVAALVEPMVCEVSGLPLKTEELRGPWSPSLDRIDNTKGYELGNVRLVCWMFNRAKAHWTDEQFMTMVRGISSRA